MQYHDKVQKSINYIEENLYEKLSLESLAENVHLSKYHFHRVFLATMGDSIMSYIRRRRLVRAAHNLIYTENSVTGIAYEYGFNTLDTFIRAFKRIYGISPNEYRKVIGEKKVQRCTRRETKLMKDWNLGERIKCTNEEKENCLNLLEQIVELSHNAHKKGLLALEDDTQDITSTFFKKALQLLLYGTEPVLLREILENYIVIGNFTGKELLERILILEGILDIQLGEYPWIIREKLGSYFGEDYIDNINKYFNILDDDGTRLDEFVDLIRDVKPASSETYLLDKELEKMNGRSVQRLLREVDISLLVIGMKGASGKIQIKIINNLSKMSKVILLEFLELIDSVNTPQIVDAQNNIIEIVKKLRVEGDII
ncbi:helix-turn-helix domain-containing protein [Wukongibacter baidiensis]|uniref:helix-turn-helix domain-containing protein n=1 Tax=Wukongibacter baidiensis TaxID=1723361 RepID=UPI003D7F6407